MDLTSDAKRAFSLQSYGAAPRVEGVQLVDLARHVDDGGALTELGIERVHLVLHDFGGPFGLAWAGAYPDAFASVGLINTPPLSQYRWHLLARAWRTGGRRSRSPTCSPRR